MVPRYCSIIVILSTTSTAPRVKLLLLHSYLYFFADTMCFLTAEQALLRQQGQPISQYFRLMLNVEIIR